jgi:hypothetical protein
MDWLFLAMAYWRKGDKQDALAWYHKATARTDEQHTRDEELIRFRAEASALLRLADEDMPNGRAAFAGPPRKEKTPTTQSKP